MWASPPCQRISSARTQGPPCSEFADNLLEWSLAINSDVLWVENVTVQGKTGNNWGTLYNAAQFEEVPRQSRNRIVGGRYRPPDVFREYKRFYPEFAKVCCPSVLASEYKGYAKDPRRAARFYGRRLTIHECAYRMGFDIPDQWLETPKDWVGPRHKWIENIYEGIGNGVFVLMAKAFGDRYK